MNVLKRIWGSATIEVVGGDAPSDRVPLRMRVDKDYASNKAATIVSRAFATYYAWIIRDGDGEVIDTGTLRRARNVRPGDCILFGKGSVKSAAMGDVLGLTCVLMPSGFAIAVPAPTTNAASTIGGSLNDDAFAYADQYLVQPFWLPKRRWGEFVPGESVPWEDVATLVGWQKRYRGPTVGVVERVRKREQMLIATGAIG